MRKNGVAMGAMPQDWLQVLGQPGKQWLLVALQVPPAVSLVLSSFCTPVSATIASVATDHLANRPSL